MNNEENVGELEFAKKAIVDAAVWGKAVEITPSEARALRDYFAEIECLRRPPAGATRDSLSKSSDSTSDSLYPAGGLEWRPISEAPRDGRWLLGWWGGDRAESMRWSEDEMWVHFDGDTTFTKPTHFAPLPSPPTKRDW